MEKLPPLGFVPLLLSRYLKRAAAGSSASHQPRTTSSDHSTDEGNTHVTHRHHDSSGVRYSPPIAFTCVSACMGRILSRGCRKGPNHLLVRQFLCSTWQPFLRPDLHIRIRRRAQKRSGMGALAPTEGSSLKASSTTARLSVSG